MGVHSKNDLGNENKTDSSTMHQVTTPPRRVSRIASHISVADHPSTQYKVLAAMQPSYHRVPMIPGGGSYRQEQYVQNTDILVELRQTQSYLATARREVDRIHNLLDEARAQAKHDREIIIGLQDKVNELERRVRSGEGSMAMVVANPGSRISGSVTGVNHENNNNNNTGNNTNGSDGTIHAGHAGNSSDVGANSHFNDSYEQMASQFAMSSNMAENAGNIERSDSTGGPISPAADLFSPFPSMVLGPQHSTPITVEDPTFNAKDFGQKLASLWKTTESYAKAYTNIPSTEGDRLIQGKLLECIMWGSSKHTVATLMNDEASRFLVIAKVLNSFIAREVLKISIVQGFDSTADSEIIQLRNHNYADTPIIVKRTMYDAAAKQVVRIRNMPLFNNFYNKRMHDKANDAFNLLTPLIRDRERNAWNDMAKVMKEAHKLALHMYSGPYEFHFRCTKMNDEFDPNVMIDRATAQDHSKAYGMHDSGHHQYRVQFATTPLVYFRNVSISPVPAMEVASGAQVLLQDIGPLQSPHPQQYQGHHEETPQRYHESEESQQAIGFEIGRPGATPHP